MSLVEAEEVPEARSCCSTSRTESPRPAASRAMPVPLMPPPTMARSKSAIYVSDDRGQMAVYGRQILRRPRHTLHRERPSSPLRSVQDLKPVLRLLSPVL